MGKTRKILDSAGKELKSDFIFKCALSRKEGQ